MLMHSIINSFSQSFNIPLYEYMTRYLSIFLLNIWGYFPFLFFIITNVMNILCFLLFRYNTSASVGAAGPSEGCISLILLQSVSRVVVPIYTPSAIHMLTARFQFRFRKKLCVLKMDCVEEVVGSLEVLKCRHDFSLGDFGEQSMHRGQKNGERRSMDVCKYNALVLVVVRVVSVVAEMH